MVHFRKKKFDFLPKNKQRIVHKLKSLNLIENPLCTFTENLFVKLL